MNVYDLDGTILYGDSEVYFYKYCFSHLKISLKAKFRFKFYYFLHRAFKVDINYTGPRQYYYLREIKDIDKVLKDFWDIHIKYIKPWYLENKKDDDVIITASPRFIEEELMKRLNIKCLFGTDMDKHTGKINSKFLYGEEKLKIYKKNFNIIPDNFYSDSLLDTPLANYSKNAFLYIKDEIKKWPK